MTLFVIGLIFISLFYYFKIFQPTEVLKFLSVALSFLLFFLALFNVTYNSDWWFYQSVYQQYIFKNYIIFNFISDFFRNRGYDYTAVYQTHITIITIAIIFFASRFKASHTFIISSVFLIFMLMQMSNQIRYYVSFTIYITSVYILLVRNNRLMFLVLASLSVLSHFGIIPLYLFLAYYYIIKDKHLTKTSILISLGASIIVLLTLRYIPSLLGEFSTYFESLSSLLGGLYSNLLWLAWIVMIFYRNRNIIKRNVDIKFDKKYRFLYKLSIFPVLFILIAVYLEIISSRYIEPFIVIWISYYLYSSQYISTTIQDNLRDFTKLILYLLISFIYVYYLPLLIFNKSEVLTKVSEILKSNNSLSFLW